MKICSVDDPSFAPYGRVVEDIELGSILAALEETPVPREGTMYIPSYPGLESAEGAAELRNRGFGGLDVQIGFCNGRNDVLTSLEYHRSSELDIAGDTIILLLALQTELEDGFRLDARKVKAFRVPAGTAVELYATTLHYAPCGEAPGRSFRMGCVLPRGTNESAPAVSHRGEGRLLLGRNKWVVAGPDTPGARSGAFVGIYGPYPDVFS